MSSTARRKLRAKTCRPTPVAAITTPGHGMFVRRLAAEGLRTEFDAKDARIQRHLLAGFERAHIFGWDDIAWRHAVEMLRPQEARR